MAVIFIFLLIFLVVGCMIYGHTYQQNHAQSNRSSINDNTVKVEIPPITVTLNREQPEVSIQRLEYFCVKDKGYHVTVWPKNQSQFDIVEFNIAGISYRDNIDNHLGEFVGTLEAEPTNAYDPNAIKVLAHDGHHVGYVPADMTEEIRNKATLPCPCYCYIGCNDDTYFSDCYIIRK